jgi:hypothetical protein
MATTLASLWEWLRRKQVQIEVTFAVYMFTPWEKFAFCRLPFGFISPSPSIDPFTVTNRLFSTDSIVFLLFSLTFIAAVLYLPHHISLLAGRVWYYINGESIDVATAREVVKSMVTSNTLSETMLPEMTKAAFDTPPLKAEL